MKKLFLLIALALLFASCLPEPAQPGAEEIMRAFFSALANGDYEAAASMYGGGYEELAQMNPDIASTDCATLWQNGCEFNGFVCMEVLDILSVTESDSQIEFNVTFQTKDGGRFEFTGCCGETMPEPITEYEVIVQKGADGNYKVLSQPPYIP
jgi:hypothetical protein